MGRSVSVKRAQRKIPLDRRQGTLISPLQVLLKQVPHRVDGGYGVEQKSPYDGDRFNFKKRINDPILFVFQVCRQLTTS
jgi:hypothetical protein